MSQVGNAKLCTQVSTELHDNYGIYIQAINPPTVPAGQELLRLAPGPHHTEEMKRDLVKSLLAVWDKCKLPLVGSGRDVSALPTMQAGPSRHVVDLTCEDYLGPVSVAA